VALWVCWLSLEQVARFACATATRLDAQLPIAAQSRGGDVSPNSVVLRRVGCSPCQLLARSSLRRPSRNGVPGKQTQEATKPLCTFRLPPPLFPTRGWSVQRRSDGNKFTKLTNPSRWQDWFSCRNRAAKRPDREWFVALRGLFPLVPHCANAVAATPELPASLRPRNTLLDKPCQLCYYLHCRQVCRHILEVQKMPFWSTSFEMTLTLTRLRNAASSSVRKARYQPHDGLLDDLTAVLAVTPVGGVRADYAPTVIEDNCLGKQTTSTAQVEQSTDETNCNALDPAVPIFHVLRECWELDKAGRPLLGVPVRGGRATHACSHYPIGVAAAGRGRIPARRKIACGAPQSRRRADERQASWTRWRATPPVRGRSRATLRAARSSAASACTPRPPPSPTPCISPTSWAFAAMDLFSSGWLALLDCSPSQGQDMALEAKRMQLLDLRISGNVVDVGFRRLDPTYEGE